MADNASLEFAPGLLDVLQYATPPTADFFKMLPDDSDSFEARWAIYALVLEKEGCRHILYVGFGTGLSGVHTRLKNYSDLVLLPHYVERAIDDGFHIVSKGLVSILD